MNECRAMMSPRSPSSARLDIEVSRLSIRNLDKSKSSMILLNLQVLDSNRGIWNVYTIEHPPWSQSGWWPTNCQALNFNKALHWLAHDGPAYNPKYKQQCIIIHRCQEMRHASYGDDAVVSETLTVSMGHLRIIQLVCYPFPNDHHHVSIWTLVDYKQSLWKQEHESVYFRDMVSGIRWIQDYMREYNLKTTKQHDMSFVMSIFIRKQPPETRERIIFPHPLLCHRTNPLIVYLYLPERIVSLDVATKRLRLVTKDIKRGMRTIFGRYELGYDMVIPMVLHLDPSLVLEHEGVLPPRRKRGRRSI
ncbi:PREDICTED: uncharacterized protein LOC104767540 [Camelina sativa]|uniref:Uncharacterized protein LOC104767540 n=1 Tax=Camelina sativa TaxID=90675 RepID=A0ABM0XRJ3_CAMSA|nr:PREDICTED: uncharacterized protein LOC104767540 [Camelina sativa]